MNLQERALRNKRKIQLLQILAIIDTCAILGIIAYISLVM